MSDTIAGKLKKISPQTIDRLLRKPKKQMKICGTSGTKPARLLHRAIPIVTWFDYAQRSTGYFQIDLVQHRVPVGTQGGNPSGEFCFTLTMTDVKTGWTVHFALMNKAAVWVRQALEMALKVLPMDLKGIHSDTGSEFLNETVDTWCRKNSVEFTRGRPTHKNDQRNLFRPAMLNRKTTLPCAKLSAMPATKARKGSHPCKQFTMPTIRCSTCITPA